MVCLRKKAMKTSIIFGLHQTILNKLTSVITVSSFDTDRVDSSHKETSWNSKMYVCTDTSVSGNNATRIDFSLGRRPMKGPCSTVSGVEKSVERSLHEVTPKNVNVERNTDAAGVVILQNTDILSEKLNTTVRLLPFLTKQV